jgi:7-cyano-7-deazaguanine synthase in queuosine biosynthesis
MRAERTVLCGGLAAPATASGEILRLNLHGTTPNVTLRLSDITKVLVVRELSSSVIDLLEVATYVWAADQAVHRGDEVGSQGKTQWRRRFEFHIPVRNLDLWRSQTVVTNLTSFLAKLTEDEFAFNFAPMISTDETAEIFDVKGVTPSVQPAELLLLSGGLDSLSGAMDAIVSRKKACILLSHTPSGAHASRQGQLVDLIAQKAGHRNFLHVPVEVNKSEALSHDYTQRSRTFLFGALAASVAHTLGLPAVTFYENGITSMNLIAPEQLTGARASRTCHPAALRRMETLFESVLGARVAVVNPFLWQTKGEVLRRLAEADGRELVEASLSCTRTMGKPAGGRPHCGNCIQCLHRRFAVLAADLGQFEPESGYDIPLITGARSALGLTTAETYLRRAHEFNRIDGPEAFLASVGSALDILDATERDPRQALQGTWDLHRRWAKEVVDVVDEGVKAHSEMIAQRRVPSDSILSMVTRTAVGSSGTTPGRSDHPLRTLCKINPRSGKSAHILLSALLDSREGNLTLREIEKLGQKSASDAPTAIRIAYERIVKVFPTARPWISQLTPGKAGDREPRLLLRDEPRAPRRRSDKPKSARRRGRRTT